MERFIKLTIDQSGVITIENNGINLVEALGLINYAEFQYKLQATQHVKDSIIKKGVEEYLKQA